MMKQSEFIQLLAKVEQKLQGFNGVRKRRDCDFLLSCNSVDIEYMHVQFDNLCNIAVYTKVYNDCGECIDLKYLYNQAHKLTHTQISKLKAILDSKF